MDLTFSSRTPRHLGRCILRNYGLVTFHAKTVSVLPLMGIYSSDPLSGIELYFTYRVQSTSGHNIFYQTIGQSDKRGIIIRLGIVQSAPFFHLLS